MAQAGKGSTSSRHSRPTVTPNRRHNSNSKTRRQRSGNKSRKGKSNEQNDTRQSIRTMLETYSQIKYLDMDIIPIENPQFSALVQHNEKCKD